MGGINHIESALSSSWSGWIMLALLVCAILSEYYQPGIILQAKNSLFTQTDRLYKDSPVNFTGQLLMTIFRIGIIAMAIYLCCSAHRSFSLAGFGVISGLLFAMAGIKMVCNLGLDFTFSLSQRFGAPYEHYGNIMTLAAVLLYPIVLVLMRVDYPAVNRWLIGGIAVLFIITWFFRACHQYITKPMDILYIFFYCSTLEVLPIAVVYILSDQITAII